MKFFIVEATFNPVIPVEADQLKKIENDHFDILKDGFEVGWILFCGPKALTKGGFVIVRGNSLEEIENIFSSDPLKINKVANFRITEFNLFDCQPAVRDWFR